LDLVNSQTNALESVPDDKATAAVTSGKYTFARGAKVPIVTEQGVFTQASPEEAFAHLAKGGTIASQGRAFEEAHSGVGSHVAAAAEGAARGLSVGLSDPAAIAAARAIGGDEAAEKVRAHLAEEREAHPYLAAGGEIAGAVAPTLLTGGTSAEAEGAGLLARGAETAGALPKALAGIGGAIERGVTSLLPEAESLAGRAAVKAVSGATGAAAENAAWGVGGAIDENSLNGGNHELTAEQLLASAGHGALLGAVVGGGLHGLMSAGGEALEGQGERISGFLRKEADRQAYRTLGATPELDRAADELGGPAAIGRTLHEEGIFGDSIGQAAVKPEEMIPRIEEKQRALGNAIGDIIERSQVKMPMGEITKPIDDLISTKLMAGNTKAAEALQGYRDKMLEGLGVAADDPTAEVPIRDVFARRQLFERQIGSEPREIQGDIQNFHRQLADAEVAGLEADGGLDGKLVAMQNKYAHLAIAKESLQKAAESGLGAGPSRVGRWLGGAAGAVAGGVVGHGMGAYIGREIGRELGSQIEGGRAAQALAYAMDRMHHLIVADRVVQDVTKQINSGMRGFVSRTVEAATRSRPSPGTGPRKPLGQKPLADRYSRRADEVREMADPNLAEARLTQSLGTLTKHAPQIAGAVGTLASSDAQYLKSILPVQPPGPSLLQPHLKQPPPSETEMFTFLRLANLLDKPLTAIDKLKKGTLLPDEAQMLQERRPGLFGQMQQSAMRAVTERTSELPHAKRMSLGILLGIPTDASLTPEFVGIMQQSYLGPAQSPPKMHSGAKLDLVHETEMDRMEQGNV
jgi:hypothetical protein